MAAARVGSAGAAAKRVVVRERAGARVLSVDGTFASFYRPGSPLTGSVWDALAVSLAWLPPARRRSVLVLGLGGGSAARLARALAPRARIVGVEIDPEVLRAARAAFDLDALGVEVALADARAFLAAGRSRFDLVIDDVFVGEGRAVRKPDWLPEPGLGAAARRVAPGGLLVSNALDEAPRVARALRSRFPAVVRIEVAGYDNRVFVAGPAGLSASGLRAAAAADPVLAPSLPRLSFRSVGRRDA
jgi:spermidine synthase